MAHTRWYYDDSLENFQDDEFEQAMKRQPYFMLHCSKIIGAKYIKEILEKEFPDVSKEGFVYFIEEEQKYFILDKNCAFLLGVFDLEKKRIFQNEYDKIKEKSAIFIEKNNEFKKVDACITYQKIVQSFLSSDSDEYTKSLELLNSFKEKVIDLKELNEKLKKEIEEMILQYVIHELKIISSESNGINIQGNIKHYLEYFIYK
jgi:hypothetical protein